MAGERNSSVVVEEAGKRRCSKCGKRETGLVEKGIEAQRASKWCK